MQKLIPFLLKAIGLVLILVGCVAAYYGPLEIFVKISVPLFFIIWSIPYIGSIPLNSTAAGKPFLSVTIFNM